jgi:RNA polymerase sigma factor (sigma-70 family)
MFKADKPSDPRAPDLVGERVALVARLFEEHNETLIRFLAVRMRSRQEAKEVAQEAYVRLLDLDQPETVGFLRAFLFKTATNIAIDRMRCRTRREQLDEVALFEEFRETPGPERHAVGRQQVEIVGRLLTELPAKCRQAFLLNRVQGLQPSEIAIRMGIAERTARHYILRAFQHCQAGLDHADCPREANHG